MGAFEYTALDTDGRNLKGVLEGDTARQVRQQLRTNGWIPLKVEELSEPQRDKTSRGRARTRGISAFDLSMLTRQLATLVQAGLPVEEALQVAARQNEKARVQKVLHGIRSRVLEGHSLSEALSDFPQVFPDLYRATVSAGEESGCLDQVMLRLADYVENRQAQTQQVQMALIYPIILTVVALGITALLLAYVVPQVMQVFEGIGADLPLSTLILLSISGFMENYGLLLLGGVFGLLIVFRVMMRQEAFKYRVHQLLYRIPLVGRLTRTVNTARFARTFGILVGSGVPALQALLIGSTVVPNLPMREALLRGAEKVREGVNLQTALAEGGYLSPMALQLIANGETTGDLAGMLERVANIHESELSTLINTLLKLFEPLLIITMAAVVLFIVMAILMPIFDLNQLVK
jgi:general secretion pathway protein F